MAVHQRQVLRPDLIDIFIIVLIAGAIDIFIFTIATQFISRTTFQHLPTFLTDAYKTVWASAVSGSAGVGLVIIKSLRTPSNRRPNYGIWVLGVAGVLLLAILAIAIIAKVLNPRPPIDVPPGVALISYGVPGPANFEFKPLPGGGDFQLIGTFSVKGDDRGAKAKTVVGNLQSGYFVIPQSQPYGPPKEVKELAFQVCYIHTVFDAEQRDNFPPVGKSENAIDIDVKPIAGQRYPIGARDFSFTLPDDVDPDRAWLCAALVTDFGYIPMQ
ncbi:hypothetical protein PH552_28945 [Rhizobium sp. CNPSo 3968]|uniref:hypothetical protein n=1 Tax=Rhizobium sp. CNPSo 3968 TaxID=3021408 RepID=UPI00254BD53C|nr:hypothetical protein [Rhizobium sp. CNPSo 3968]MDK4723387.1 hypothetical protein [Rhizobium sp. CNPSo 3968]